MDIGIRMVMKASPSFLRATFETSAALVPLGPAMYAFS